MMTFQNLKKKMKKETKPVIVTPSVCTASMPWSFLQTHHYSGEQEFICIGCLKPVIAQCTKSGSHSCSQRQVLWEAKETDKVIFQRGNPIQRYTNTLGAQP